MSLTEISYEIQSNFSIKNSLFYIKLSRFSTYEQYSKIKKYILIIHASKICYEIFDKLSQVIAILLIQVIYINQSKIFLK